MSEKGSSTNKLVKCHQKQHWDAEEKRRQGRKKTVQLRKAKKSQQLSKRRMLHSRDEAPEADLVSALYTDDAQAISYMQQLDSTVLAPHPDESEKGEVTEAGVVSRLVGCLTKDDSELQCVAACLLTSITAGTSERTRLVVACKAIPALISLLSSANATTKRYALLTLGNIAEECEEFRKELLSANILPPMLELLRRSTELPLIESGSFCLSQFSQDIPGDRAEIYSILINLLRKHKDVEVLAEVCWAFRNFMEDKTSDVFIGQEVCLRLVDLLAHESEEVVRPVLSVVEQIVSGDDAQVDVIVSCSLLPRLHHLLVHCDGMKAEISSVFIGLAASNNMQVQSEIDAFLPLLVQILMTGAFEAKCAAIRAIHNATARLNPKHTHIIVHDLGFMKCLCDLLKVPATDTIDDVLCTINNILEVGKREAHGDTKNVYAEEMEERQVLEEIEKLQYHAHMEICTIANYITDTYFNRKQACE